MRRVLAAAVIFASPVYAQEVPTIDTEDATLGATSVGEGAWHPEIGFDVRNGDFARGSYDDDRADLGRLPVHVQIGVGGELHRGADGRADAWLVLRSSNGFHAAAADERVRPRGWYESNNLAALVFVPVKGLHAGLAYTIKASPNGVADTTHEASATFAFDGERGIGALHPRFATTWRPRGGGGVYTQAGIEPEMALTDGEDGPTASLPLALGVGWGGFYSAGSATRVFGQAGVAVSQPLTIGDAHWAVRAEVLALVRDDRLARLSGPMGETATVVPLATIGVSLAY